MAWLKGIWSVVSGWAKWVILGAVAAFSIVAYHLSKVSSAKKQGKERERDRIQAKTHRESNRIRERTDEIEDTIDDYGGDDLRRRMRESATDGDSD